MHNPVSIKNITVWSAQHRNITIASWICLVIAAGLITLTYINSAVTTDLGFTNEPESIVAADLIRDSGIEIDLNRSEYEVLIIHSHVYLVDDENFIEFFETVTKNEYDLAYFDPPYGSNNDKMPTSRVRYASYYHLWTTIINHDKPKLFGKANRREDTRDVVATSIFEEFRKNKDGAFIAMSALDKLIQSTNSKYILLSYSSGGRATKEELNNIINTSGKLLKAIEIDYKKNVMSNMRWTNDWINSDGKYVEYLFLMKKY